MFAFRIAALLVVLGAPMAGADVASRVSDSFRAWSAQVGAKNAVLTLWHKGKLESDVVVGEGAADQPVELASLSKAITAVCVAELITDGVWQRGTTSFDVLGYGKKGVTLSQMLTHGSGIGPDETQSFMPIWFGASEDRSALAAERALGRDTQDGRRGTFFYNNENYAILGEMITQQTGQPYAQFCAEKVLKTAGVTTAQPSERTGSFLPFGGWTMSVQDYARFQWHGFGPGGRIGHKTTNWPQTIVRPRVQYGMGMFVRLRRDVPNYWHFGALCFPGRMNIGSYAVIWQGDWQIVAAYDICANQKQMGDLDRALGKAVYGG